MVQVSRGSSDDIEQGTVAHNDAAVERDRRPEHRQVEVPGGEAAGELVGAGREQEIAGQRAQFRAIEIAAVVGGPGLATVPIVPLASSNIANWLINRAVRKLASISAATQTMPASI